MVGPAIRYLEIARSLARLGHEVHVCDPGSERTTNYDEVQFVPRRRSELTKLRRSFDVVLFSPYVSHSPFSSPPLLKSICERTPSVVDLYDPSLIESIGSWRVRGWSSHQLEFFGSQVISLMWALRHGDYFLCASYEQKLYYLGLLTVAGRLNPSLDIESRIGIVPVGTPANPPTRTAIAFRRGVISERDFVFLWPGGLFDWYDGVSAVRAFKYIASEHDDVHLVFVGAYSANWDSPSREYLQTMDEACQSRLLNSRIHFVDWLPYDIRGSMYLEANCGVLTYRKGLENLLSFRSRIVDCIWGGLPLILTEGNQLADLVRTREAGVTVRAEDSSDIAAKMETFVSSPELRDSMASNCRNLASLFGWDSVIRQLNEFCENPSIAPDKLDRGAIRHLRRGLKSSRILPFRTRELAGRMLEILREQSPRDLTRRTKEYYMGLYGLK